MDWTGLRKICKTCTGLKKSVKHGLDWKKYVKNIFCLRTIATLVKYYPERQRFVFSLVYVFPANVGESEREPLGACDCSLNSPNQSVIVVTLSSQNLTLVSDWLKYPKEL